MLENACGLEAVIATSELEHRASREADSVGEARATLQLIRDLSKAPETFFPKLVRTVLEFSNADSAGISLLDNEQGKFVWPAVVGGLSSFVGAGTPADFGPCGTVLERDAPVLFQHPERHFTYLIPIAPALEEVLLVPFHMDGKPVGTIWAVIHEENRQFDAEDLRLLENLSGFAATAYRSLVETGALKSLLGGLPAPPPVKPMTHEAGKWSFVKK